MLWGKREGQAIENDDGECANGIRKAISDIWPNIWGESHKKYTGKDDSVPYEQQIQSLRQEDVFEE